MPVLYRNTNGGPMVFTDPVSKLQVEWKGSPDPAGEDHQFVPDEILKTVQFQKIVRQGHLEMIEEATAEDAVERQLAAQQQSRAAADQAAQAAFANNRDASMVVLKCIGPGTRPGAQCDTDVPVRNAQVGKVPPLCDQHKRLEHEFTPVVDENENGPDGRAATKWIRYGGLEPRQRV